jgi:hypothetical protein
MPAMGAATWLSPLKRLPHVLFVDESAPTRTYEKRTSFFLSDQIYSSGYIGRVPSEGADTQRNEVHGMCFEFAGKDAG